MPRSAIEYKDNAHKFRVIGGRRVKDILSGLTMLANCADTKAYTYTDIQVKHAIDAIRAKLAEVEKSFREKKVARTEEGGFFD